jgi:surface antigen
VTRLWLETLRALTPLRYMRNRVGSACAKCALWMAAASALAVASPLVSAAHAQLLNPFRGYRGPMMNDQDRKLAREALRTLLNQEPAIVGKVETWNNPADGRHGSLTMGGSFRHSSMDCRTVQSSVSYPDWATPRTFTVKLCRTPRGEWKML